MESGEPACQQDTSRPAKGKRGTEKEKGEENSKTPQDRQKAKGEQKRKKGKRTARHLKTSKRQKGNRKGKRGREPTIVIVFFHITTIVGESSQKLNKIGKTFSSRCGVYLAIPRKDKSIKQKTKAGESEEKDKSICNCLTVRWMDCANASGFQETRCINDAVPHLVQPHSPCTILQTSAKEAWVFFRRH
jgi:hypothetical protein